MLPVKIIVTRKDGRTTSLSTWALCDGGSNSDCIRADIVRKLGIETFKAMTSLTTLSEMSSEMKYFCNFYVSNLEESGGFDVTDAMIANNFQGRGERPPRDADIADQQHLVNAGVNFRCIGTETIGVLLSVKKSWVWECGETVR